MNQKDFENILEGFPVLKKRIQMFQNEMFKRNASYPFDFIKIPIEVTQK